MLKALHALQKENQRLQEQILSLTAKKERLQVLNVQLSVPFPALPAALPATNGPIPGPYGLLPQGEGIQPRLGGRIPARGLSWLPCSSRLFSVSWQQ
jgi:hypothetical protein